MKRLVLILFLIALPAQLSADAIYVIQSRSVADIYGESLGHILKQRYPTRSVRILNLRDFEVDRHTHSRDAAMRLVQERVEPYNNLVLLGQELESWDIAANKVIIPQLIGVRAESAASPQRVLDVANDVQRHVPHSRSIYYVLSDPTQISQLRLREFRRLIAADRSSELISFTVRRSSELRSALLDIQTSASDSGILVHNIFSIVDEDSFRVVYSDFVDSIITQYNRKHIEIGVLKPNQNLAIGVGAGPHSVVDAVIAGLEDTTPVLLGNQVAVNLTRISELGLNNFVIREGRRISRVGDSGYAP